MNLRSLKWIGITAPIVIIGILQYVRYALGPMLASWSGQLLMDGAVLIGAVFFYGVLFTVVDQLQSKLERQNRELEALYGAGLSVSAELSVEAVLQRIVGEARALLATRYGALAIYREDGSIESFVSSGMDPEVIAQLGHPPTGRGIFGLVLEQGESLRLTKISDHPKFSGFPEGHPPIDSLLAVPIVCRGPYCGNLYLAERNDRIAFTDADHETLKRFAFQAAVAVDNAQLHAQAAGLAVAEERLRIAHEMHDGLAQVLAYVNTKAQAVGEFLKVGKANEARSQLEQLASAAREVSVDVREGILGLRSVTDGETSFVDALARHLERWQDQCGIPVELAAEDLPPLPMEVELQLLRIVQESLANVRKHSAAKGARVSVFSGADQMRIVIEDDGVGFSAELDRAARPRFGLATMRERAEAIGGELEIESVPGEGTVVEFRLDLTS